VNPAFEEVLANARTLPDPEKEELARILMSDLGEERDEEIRAAWIEEARSRDDAYLRGEITASPIAEAAARVLTRLSR
jgi:hypothetical protein